MSGIVLMTEMLHASQREVMNLRNQLREKDAEIERLRAESASDDGRGGMPLRAAIEGDQLVLSIGIKTLAFAFESSEENNPYDDDFCDTKRLFSIADPLEFAKDICRAINDEGEDGSTPLTRFLDSMMQEAVEQGSLGIHDLP